VTLAIDVYTPTDGPEGTDGFPVVLEYTPYQRATIHPETGEVKDKRNHDAVRALTSRGYVFARADMRGTGTSSGWLLDFMPAIWDDGKQLVDWIADQDWCDGNVGMMGGSYLGWSQTATASRKPEALKCIMPAVIPLEGYTGEVYPGGIYLQGFLNLWSGFMYPSQRSYFDPDSGMWPCKPAVDEDGDGEYHDEIPIDQNGNGTFLDDGFPPKYADGEGRDHLYFLAIRGHEKNFDYASWAKDAPFIDSTSPLGYTMYDLGPNAHVEAMMESEIPVYHVGGWFDGFARGTFELFETLRPTNPSKAIVFPGYHDVTGGPYYDHVGADVDEAKRILLIEHLRWFDYHLKGIDNGIMDDPPLTYYAMHGGGWQQTNAWPVETMDQTLHFTPEGSLSASGAEDGTRDYTADLTHSSVYGENNGNRWVGIGGNEPKALPVRNAQNEKCLTYTSAPLGAALEITGHPVVTLSASSTEAYGDFFVYLEDVSPAGDAVLVTEAQLRAGYAALHDNDLIVFGGKSGVEVLPELPWHGYERQHYADGILKDRTELVIDFQPTSWTFREGHRIRVSIACSDWPTFRLHPKLSPQNDPAAGDNSVPTITVYSGENGSRLMLPVRK
jgi:hypothetical protein